MANEQIAHLFNEARAAEYSELDRGCRKTLATHRKGKDAELPVELEKHQRRFNEIRGIDYFNSPAAPHPQMLPQRGEKPPAPKENRAPPPEPYHVKVRGQTALTRPPTRPLPAAS